MGKVVRISDRTKEVINILKDTVDLGEYISDSDFLEIAVLYYAEKVYKLDVENI